MVLGFDYSRLVDAALGITVYWPVACLAAVVAARGSAGWNLSNESDYWLVLPLVSLGGLWGLWHISRQRLLSSRH